MSATILIVDDDEAIRDTLQGVLSGEGFVVVQAENGAHALELLRGSLQPNLIILDLMMPVMSGWEFLEVADADETLAQFPILVLSAMAAPLRKGKAKGGVRRCVSKPLSMDTLLEAVQSLLATGPSSVEHEACP